MVKYPEPLNINFRKVEIYEHRVDKDNFSSMEEAYQILTEPMRNEFIQKRREGLGKNLENKS
ncbi:MAG: hypothetical protein KJ646_03600 [Nanoarchaeota archaeon]|nr:hypothetical protein [Nanoarchaeota archaeon]MBU4117033.1 hypothetical protein [Nanoarchaeota archaeon]